MYFPTQLHHYLWSCISPFKLICGLLRKTCHTPQRHLDLHHTTCTPISLCFVPFEKLAFSKHLQIFSSMKSYVYLLQVFSTGVKVNRNFYWGLVFFNIFDDYSTYKYNIVICFKWLIHFLETSRLLTFSNTRGWQVHHASASFTLKLSAHSHIS